MASGRSLPFVPVAKKRSVAAAFIDVEHKSDAFLHVLRHRFPITEKMSTRSFSEERKCDDTPEREVLNCLDMVENAEDSRIRLELRPSEMNYSTL